MLLQVRPPAPGLRRGASAAGHSGRVEGRIAKRIPPGWRGRGVHREVRPGQARPASVGDAELEDSTGARRRGNFEIQVQAEKIGPCGGLLAVTEVTCASSVWQLPKCNWPPAGSEGQFLNSVMSPGVTVWQ